MLSPVCKPGPSSSAPVAGENTELCLRGQRTGCWVRAQAPTPSPCAVVEALGVGLKALCQVSSKGLRQAEGRLHVTLAHGGPLGLSEICRCDHRAGRAEETWAPLMRSNTLSSSISSCRKQGALQGGRSLSEVQVRPGESALHATCQLAPPRPRARHLGTPGPDLWAWFFSPSNP